MFSKADIERYFIAEKQLNVYALCIAGAIFIAAIIFFFFLKTNFYKGAAVPMFLVAVFMLMIGYPAYKKSDSDRIRNVYAFDMNPSELQQKELPRVKKAVKSITVFRYAEIALILAGIMLFIYFRKNEDQYFWKGFGLSLAIMAFLVFIIDTSAAKKTDIYIKGLESFVSGNQS